METYIRDKALLNYAKALNESFGDDCEALLDLNHMINVYGRTYAADPKEFIFHAGDIKLIKSLVEHVKNSVDRKGANTGLHKFRGRKKKSAHSVFANKMLKENVPSSNQLKNEICVNTTVTHSQHETLKIDLLRKTMASLESYGVDEPVAASLNEDMVEVHFEENHIYGGIVCVICKDENAKNQKPKRVYYHQSSGSSYWVIANFSKHLESSHGLALMQNHLLHGAKCKKAVHKNVLKSKNVPVDRETMSECVVKPDTDLTTSPADVGTIEDVIIAYDNVGKVEFNNSLEIVSTVMIPKVVIEIDLLYHQISEQMTKIIEAVLINGDVQETMIFKLNGEERSLTVAQIEGNGNCLFAAICHQLFYCQIDGESHSKQTANLRETVVNYILKPENYPSFEYALKDRVYEIKGHDKIENMTNECKLYARLILSRSGQWGGYETIKAVGEMFKINIIIFNENGGCYIANKSTQIYERTIALAYRMSCNSIDEKFIRNHYDSVSDIDTHVLYEIAKCITK